MSDERGPPRQDRADDRLPLARNDVDGDPVADDRPLLERARGETAERAGRGEKRISAVVGHGDARGDEPVRFVVVYCQICGTALGTAS